MDTKNTNLKSKKLIHELGSAGLAERLDKATIAEGVKHSKELIELVHDMTFERDPHFRDDTFPDMDFFDAYNALGAIYPFLSRELKDNALRAYLKQFDGINYRFVQINHTTNICEPLVLADLRVIRPKYWPGLDEGKEKIKSYRNFEEFKDNLMTADGIFIPEKVKSDFCVAYAAIRSDMSPYGAEYAKECHPDFLKRVVKGIVNMRFGSCENKNDIIKGHARLRELLPQEIHPLIDKNYELKDLPKKSDFP